MQEEQALTLREVIVKNDLSNLLELGTFYGKGSAYMAAILEDLGRGTLVTLDRNSTLRLKPNVHDILRGLNLDHRVTVHKHPRSSTITLMEMLEEEPARKFDFCYFDAGHVWDVTGFMFMLVDLMLVPGAWVVFDDLDWTLAKHWAKNPKSRQAYPEYSDEEGRIPQVRKVFEILPRKLGYINISEPHPGWGLAQKPPSAVH
jgi:predicted O-methyltransferase YrrM